MSFINCLHFPQISSTHNVVCLFGISNFVGTDSHIGLSAVVVPFGRQEHLPPKYPAVVPIGCDVQLQLFAKDSSLIASQTASFPEEFFIIKAWYSGWSQQLTC